MTVTENQTRAYDPINVATVDFWSQTADEREEAFKVLRRERPLSWQPPLEGGLMPPDNEGVWVATSHELIQYISKNPELFCSGEGFQFEEVPSDILEAAGSFLGMDAPQHPKVRRLVSSAFTPKQVQRIRGQIDDQAKKIVDDLLQTTDGDFVAQVSKKLPMWTIYDMVGLEDPAKREVAAHHAEGMVSWADEEVAAGREPGEVLNDSLVGLLTIGMELAEERRSNPKADLWTNLVNAEIDGQHLTDEEIGSFFVLLSVAGNDTTKNTVSINTLSMQQFPDQKALLMEDYDGRIGLAIEEFVRWASPIMTFRRTATQDTELGGHQIRKGEWVAMVYSSGNRDEKVFDRPDVFDISRDPNPHLGFGGGGPHYCMGNFVAKMQLRALFKELLFRAPTLQLGEPEYLTGNFVRAIKRMPYTLR